MKSNITKGFTLIELLVVILIISIILGLSMFGLQNARQSSRDTKRTADLEALRSALELYKSDNDTYPTDNVYTGGTAGVLVDDGYLDAPIIDPIASRDYVYQVAAGSCDSQAGCIPVCDVSSQGCCINCSQYYIWALFEDPPTMPTICPASPPNCEGTTNCNYCVKNP